MAKKAGKKQPIPASVAKMQAADKKKAKKKKKK